MGKQVSINNIDKIIKTYGHEASSLKYKVGDTEIIIEVDPKVSLERRINSIAGGVALSWLGDDTLIEGMLSLSYGYALISCFTNIKTDNVNKVTQLITSTNIVADVEEKLPDNVLTDFSSDFYDSYEFEKTKSVKLNNLEKICDVLVGIVESFGGVISSLDEETIKKYLNFSGTDESEINEAKTLDGNKSE